MHDISGLIGNVNILIQIDGKNTKINNITINKSGNNDNLILENNISTIDEYNKYKKLARYITEYIYWLYSKYLHEKNINSYIDMNSVEILKDFKNKYIRIDENYDYNTRPIYKIFSMDSGVILGNKLVLKSEENLKRLFYILKLMLNRNSEKIMTYYTRKTIENYYVDITDFNQYNFQIILEGEKSILKWIDEKNKKNIIYNKIILNILDKPNANNDKPNANNDKDDDFDEENDIEYVKNKEWDVNAYFFKNNLISNKIYIAQNIDSLLKAINIGFIWKKHNYNPGKKVDNINEIYEFTLYSYINKNKIKKHKIDGITNDYDIKIIGFRYNDMPLYTVLLDI